MNNYSPAPRVFPSGGNPMSSMSPLIRAVPLSQNLKIVPPPIFVDHDNFFKDIFQCLDGKG